MPQSPLPFRYAQSLIETACTIAHLLHKMYCQSYLHLPHKRQPCKLLTFKHHLGSSLLPPPSNVKPACLGRQDYLTNNPKAARSLPEIHGVVQMLGMHGTVFANFAVDQSDLLLAFGVRFDDRVTGKLETFAANAKIVHIDIDPAELNKNKESFVTITGKDFCFLFCKRDRMTIFALKGSPETRKTRTSV